MSIKRFEINKKVKRDSQVMLEGSDTDALHDDLVPLASFLRKALRVLLTFSAALCLPLIASLFLTNPEEIGLEPTDSIFQALLKFSARYAEVEFLWGTAAGLCMTVALMYICLKVFKFRRKRGWATVATGYELESLFAIRPIFGLPFERYPVESLSDRKSATSEAFMSLETMLDDAVEGGLPKVIAVTSSQPAEGKSTIAIGMAATIARTGRKVLLIDADMRSPHIHLYLRTANDKGLSNYLAGEDSIKSIETELQIDVVPSGPYPPSGGELLRSERLRNLLHRLSQDYDHIVIDTPPVLGIVDSVRISRDCDLIIFAVEANRTWVYHALGAIRRLGSGRNVVPVVTKIPPSQAGYTYGYGYGYGYDYGDSKGYYQD